MSKDKDTDWNFDPSSEDEFIKNIELALHEEVKQEKIDTDVADGIQIINTLQENKEKPEDELIQMDTIMVEDNTPKFDDFTTENTTVEAETESLAEADESEDTIIDYEPTDFAAIENAVHKQVEYKWKEVHENAKEAEEDILVADITKSLADQLEDSATTPTEVTQEEPLSLKRKLFRIGMPMVCVLVTILFLFTFFRYTTPGRNLVIKVGAWFAAERSNYDDGSKTQEQIVPDEVEDIQVIEQLPELKEDEVELKAEDGTARHEDYAVNILLLGEETIDSGTSRGRTDGMLILTLNEKDKSIKLTSLMRDMYVQIPGHLDNKLNSAYATGGIPLLYETIELNFDLKLDGYALVGFNNFEKIVDMLDGVDISLTKEEANWLNTTNYISNPLYRTVVEGMNHMNGNQALGYCRIRGVGTSGKEYNDFGRTSRHRILMDAVFDRYKSLGLWDLASVANSCLPMITTDLDANEIERYLKMAVDIGLSELQQYRIPADNTFEYATIRQMSVIVPDLTKNVEILQEYIFGTEE